MDLSSFSQRLIVHFGMPKTGSTSIQRSLYRNFDDERFQYIDIGEENPSDLLIAAFTERPLCTNFFRKSGTSQQEIERIGERTRVALAERLTEAARNKRSAILSAEALVILNERELGRFVDFVGKYYTNIIFFGYVRSPKAYMESIFQQGAKMSYFVHFDIKSLYPKYRNRIGHYDNLVGQKHVIFRKFAPENFVDKCVVRDFCRQFDVDLSKIKVRYVNEGLSLPSVQLLYTYKKFGPGHGVGQAALHENGALVDFVSGLAGPKLKLHSELVEPVLAANHEDTAWMEQRLGESLQEDLRAHDSVAVRSETDMFAIGPETLQWVAERLGPEFVERCRGELKPKDVAEWMHLLRLKLAGSRPETARAVGPAASLAENAKDIKIRDLLQAVKRDTPALAAIPDRMGAKLLREVFRRINTELDGLDDGTVSVPALGSFRIKTRSPKKGDQKTLVKKTAFHPPHRRQL